MIKFKIPERFNAVTAPEVEKKLLSMIQREKPDRLVCDFSETEYMSSAGLRVMLLVYKKMKAIDGESVFCGVRPEVFSIFKMAGFTHVLNIQQEDVKE
jgi:anti-anti-sigma factor